MQPLHDKTAELLGCDAGALPAEATALRDLDGWDSLKHVMLVLGLEREAGKKLSADEIKSVVTVGDVCRVLRENGVCA